MPVYGLLSDKMPSETNFRRHGRKLLRGKRFEQEGFAALHDIFQQIDVRMLPGWARASATCSANHIKPCSAASLQFSIKTFRQGIVQLERTELALNGGNVVNRLPSAS